MKLNRVMIHVDFGRRVRLYPEGGLELECWVDEFGWVMDNDADVADDQLADLLRQAAAVALASADKLTPATA